MTIYDIKQPCIRPTNATRTRYNEEPHFREGLYDLGTSTYAWMVPNGSWGEANAGLIVGDGESLIVDTLWDVKYTQTMLDMMQFLIEEAPINTVVNTHADGDHFWGNQLFKDAEIIASKAACKEMGHIKPGQMRAFDFLGKALRSTGMLGAKALATAQVGHWFSAMGEPYDFQDVTHTPATFCFEGNKTLDIGGRTVELIAVGSAHTGGDTLVHVPDAKALFAADIVFLGSTPVIWAGPLQNWINVLDMMMAMDNVETIVPGHGPITDKAGLQLLKNYWLYVEEEVGKRFAQGMSAKRAAFDIALSDSFAAQPFASWDSPERLMTNVHTLYRALQGNTKKGVSVPVLLNIMRKQALLAHALPNGSPKMMRLP